LRRPEIEHRIMPRLHQDCSLLKRQELQFVLERRNALR